MPDPGNPQAFNRYAYNLNNPINYIDPTGHGPQRALAGGDGAMYIAGALVTAAAVLQVTPDLDWSRIADWYSGINVAEMWALHDNMAAGDDEEQSNADLAQQVAGNVAGSPGDFDPNDDDYVTLLALTLQGHHGRNFVAVIVYTGKDRVNCRSWMIRSKRCQKSPLAA